MLKWDRINFYLRKRKHPRSFSHLKCQPIPLPQLPIEALCLHLLWGVDPYDIQVAVVNTLFIFVGVASTAFGSVVDLLQVSHVVQFGAGSWIQPSWFCAGFFVDSLWEPQKSQPCAVTPAHTGKQQGMRGG